MEYDLIITNLASEEIERAVAYYNHINPDHGTRFRSELSSVYKKLSTNPPLYAVVLRTVKAISGGIRLKSFPYLVAFEISDKKVVIFSVMNVYKNSPVC